MSSIGELMQELPANREDEEKPTLYRCSLDCRFCGRECVGLWKLKTHELIHIGEKPFKCDLCSKAFSCRSGLLQHQRVHTVEKPFRCDQCSKAFARKSGLDKHYLVHTGEKSFRCDQCSKTFARKGDHDEHYRIHEGVAAGESSQVQDRLMDQPNSSEASLCGETVPYSITTRLDQPMQDLVDNDKDDDEESVVCSVCGFDYMQETPGNKLLLCDGAGCKVAVHLGCHRFSRSKVPKGSWFCDPCKDNKKTHVESLKCELCVVSGEGALMIRVEVPKGHTGPRRYCHVLCVHYVPDTMRRSPRSVRSVRCSLTLSLPGNVT